MNYNEFMPDSRYYILKVIIPLPLRKIFDYILSNNINIDSIKIGMRVLVPFGSKKLIGIIAKIQSYSMINFSKLRPIFLVIDSTPIISIDVLNLIIWTHDYYHYPIGNILVNVLPKQFLRKKYIEIDLYHNRKMLIENNIIHNKIENKRIIQNNLNPIINNLSKFTVFLLNGISNDDKNAVYFQLINSVLFMGKQVLILVPEINDTINIMQMLSVKFHVDIIILHSNLTDKERLHLWQMSHNGVASIIIGTRSAVFISVERLGMIIVDNEHDILYKQQSKLRYSARDLAIMRGKFNNIPIILSSSTPSIESIYNVKNNRYTEINFNNPIKNIVNINYDSMNINTRKSHCDNLKNILYKIKEHVENNKKVLIFANKRGFSSRLICSNCNWTANCNRCDVKLTVYLQDKYLRCYCCQQIIDLPKVCPQCSNNNFLTPGIGGEKIEYIIKKLIPNVQIAKLDRNIIKKETILIYDYMVQKIEKNQILICTQIIPKLCLISKIDMIVVFNIDQNLYSHNFRAMEYLAQAVFQILQYTKNRKELYLQTYNGNNPMIMNLVSGSYINFINDCLLDRKDTKLPPYSYIALLQAESKITNQAFEFLNFIINNIKLDTIDNSIELFGPIPLLVEKKAGYCRQQILIQSKSRKKLHIFLNEIINIINELKIYDSIKWFLDIDPVKIN